MLWFYPKNKLCFIWNLTCRPRSLCKIWYEFVCEMPNSTDRWKWTNFDFHHLLIFSWHGHTSTNWSLHIVACSGWSNLCVKFAIAVQKTAWWSLKTIWTLRTIATIFSLISMLCANVLIRSEKPLRFYSSNIIAIKIVRGPFEKDGKFKILPTVERPITTFSIHKDYSL